MINNLIAPLKEEAWEDAEHKICCDTELTTNTNEIGKDRNRGEVPRFCDKFKVLMENLAMEVAEISAQVSRLREEVCNANFIRHEETATNEEAIKDVQDVQSNLTQAIQILADFYAKVGQANY